MGKYNLREKKVREERLQKFLQEVMPFMDDHGVTYEEVPVSSCWKITLNTIPTRITFYPKADRIHFPEEETWKGEGLKTLKEMINADNIGKTC